MTPTPFELFAYIVATGFGTGIALFFCCLALLMVPFATAIIIDTIKGR